MQAAEYSIHYQYTRIFLDIPYYLVHSLLRTWTTPSCVLLACELGQKPVPPSAAAVEALQYPGAY